MNSSVKKGKKIMIFSLGIMALILTIVMFVQFKTVKETDITAIETMRETELRTELSSWKSKYDEIMAKLEDTEEKINNYKDDIENNKEDSQLITEELDDTKAYLGYTDLEGEGISITLQDTDESQVQSSDLLSLVNELRLAGAEAISINDERIVSTTEIVNVDTRFIIINGKRIVGPYTINAIGDKKYLDSAISIKGGYVDQIKAKELDIDYSVQDNLKILKYTGEMKLEYAEQSK
jgi:uncharacterized protein YlxW (UPF0749 family)